MLPTRLCRSELEEVTSALITFINTSIMARGHPVQPDDDLETAGLDSMALLKVPLFIEAEFEFWMPSCQRTSAPLVPWRTTSVDVGARPSDPAGPGFANLPVRLSNTPHRQSLLTNKAVLPLALLTSVRSLGLLASYCQRMSTFTLGYSGALPSTSTMRMDSSGASRRRLLLL